MYLGGVCTPVTYHLTNWTKQLIADVDRRPDSIYKMVSKYKYRANTNTEQTQAQSKYKHRANTNTNKEQSS